MDETAPPSESAPETSPSGAPEGDAAGGGAPPAAAPQASDAPKPPERRKWSLGPVDGQETEEELTDDEVRARLRLAKAADKRFWEASRLRKEAEEKESRWKQNPRSFLETLEPDARRQFLEGELADIVYQSQVQRMSPEERQAYEDKRELQTRRQQETEYRAQQEKQKQEEETGKWASGVAKSFQEALATGGIPQTKHSVGRMLALYSEAQERGLEYSPQELAEQVREDYLEDVNHLTAKMSGEELLSRFGPLAQKVQQALLERHRKGRQQTVQQAQPRDADPPRGPDGKFLKPGETRFPTMKEFEVRLGLKR